MRTATHINAHTVKSVEVEAHPNPEVDLSTLTIVEASVGGHETSLDVSMRAECWQKVADDLAALGIVARVAELVPA